MSDSWSSLCSSTEPSVGEAGVHSASALPTVASNPAHGVAAVTEAKTKLQDREGIKVQKYQQLLLFGLGHWTLLPAHVWGEHPVNTHKATLLFSFKSLLKTPFAMMATKQGGWECLFWHSHGSAAVRLPTVSLSMCGWPGKCLFLLWSPP